MKKILFLHEKYKKNGGAEKYIETERKRLEKNGDITFLFTLVEKNIDIENSEVLNVKKNKLLGYSLEIIRVYLFLKKYINKIKPDLIYVQNVKEFPYSFLMACRGYKTTRMVHDFGIVCPTSTCVYKDSSKICNGKMGIKCLKHKCISPLLFLSYFIKLKYIKNSKITEEYLVPSKILKRYMLNNGFKNVKTIELPLEIFNGKEKIKKSKNTFIYVGGLKESKGIYLLIEAFKEIIKLYPFVRLEILGSGPEEKNVKDILNKYSLNNNIFLLGEIENEDMYKYFRGALALIVPSICMESCPYAVRESIFFNIPVIGSNAGGIKEQIDGSKKGILFIRNNKEDLINKMKKLIENGH